MPNEEAQGSITTTMSVIPKVDTSALKSSVDKIRSAFEGAFSGLGKGRADFFGKISSSVNGATQKLKEFNAPVKELKSSFASFRNEIGKSGAFKAFSKIGNFVTAPMRKMVANFKEGIKHATGFFSAIKRIAIYRAIRSALKAITQGFQEGRQNAYQWSVITGNQFARSMDMMATSALYLKNSLGAMTMPLTNYLAPILDRLIDQFVELINIVNRFIATITGASSWVKALKYPAEYMEQTAGSAKELKNQLLGFDDLNVLNAPSGSGSASAMDYSKMFEQVELNMSNMSFTKALQDAIKDSDWVRVGEVLSEQLNMMVESIDAKKISKWLGDKLNSAIRLVHTLLRQIDFQQIGFKIGEFISNLQLDWGRIASSWVLWATNIADTLLGVISGVNWSNIGHAIGEYIKGLFNTFAEWINGVDWKKAIDSLTQAFLDLIRGIDWHGVLSSLLAGFTGILNAFVSSLTATGNALWKLIKGDMSDYNNAVRTLNGYRPIYAPQGTNTGRQGNAITGSANSHQHGMQTIDIFANGGFPEQGTMFIAGESGAEVVSQIGGRTGVYNADQMTGALATANEGVVSTLTAVGNAIVGAINRKDMSISTSDMRNAINKMNVRYGV